jgi:chaperonin GroEL (HSP60 family)
MLRFNDTHLFSYCKIDCYLFFDSLWVMAHLVSFGFEARQKLLEGVEILYKAVSVTLGPKGKNVIYPDPLLGALITKDGVTVAKQVELADPLANVGVILVRQASMQTADEAGDGTTTAVVLAYAIYSEACLQNTLKEGLTMRFNSL